jgi:putative redox protein
MPTELVLTARHQGGMRVLAETDRHSIPTDYPLEAGQDTAGMTSLQLLLASLATCSANGVMLVLQRRMGLEVAGLEVEVRAERRDEHPTVLTRIALDFRIRGKGLEEEAVARAIRTAEAHLCPVWVMVGAGTPIDTTYTITEN